MTRTTRLGFLLLVLTPLAYLPGDFTDDDAPKRLLVSLAALLVLVAWWWPVVKGRPCPFRRDRLILPLLLAWAASFVSFLASVLRGGNPYEAFWPLVLPASGLIAYMAVSNLPDEAKDVRDVLPYGLVGVACVVAVYGLLQRVGIDPLNPAWANPDREAGSTLGGKTFAGEYLALVFPLALALAFTAVSGIGRSVATGGIVLIGVHLLVTGARGAWLGAAAGAGGFVILGLVRRFGPDRRRALPARSVALAAGGLLALALMAQIAGVVDWVGRLRGVVVPEPGRDTMLVRFELWKSTIAMSADHPVFGVGPGQYDLNIQPYRSGRELRESDPQRLGRAAGMAHNDFLHHLAETGALGGAVVVLVLYALVRKSSAHLRSQGDRRAYLLTTGLLSGVLGTAAAGLVGNALHQPAVGAMAMLFLGMAERAGNPSPEARSIGVSRRARVGAAFMLGCAVCCLMVGVRGLVDDVVYARFLAGESRTDMDGEGPWRGDHSDWLGASMERRFPWGGPDRWEIRRSLGLIYMRSMHPQDRVRAAVHLQRARALNPGDPEIWNAWGMLCMKEGRRDEGREAFERAVRLDPIVRQPRLNLALACDQDGLPDKALAQYEALVRLDPRDAEAHLWRGMTLAKTGRHAEAAEAFVAAEHADHHAENVRRFDLRGNVRRLDALEAFRESEAGRRWLEGGP